LQVRHESPLAGPTDEAVLLTHCPR